MARLRSLRTAVRLLAGPRGIEVGHRLLTAEISRGDPDALAAAEAEFDRLGPVDQRRILASFAAITPTYSEEGGKPHG